MPSYLIGASVSGSTLASDLVPETSTDNNDHDRVVNDGSRPSQPTMTVQANDSNEHPPRDGHVELNPNGASDHDAQEALNSNPHPTLHPADPLATSRYNRQMLIPSISLTGQRRIASSRILIIGLGGLGSPAALYLAAAGVGKLGLLDDDKVELSNLHRQIVHTEESVRGGVSKVESAVRGCRAVNEDEGVGIVGHEMRMDVSEKEGAEKVMGVFGGYDVVLDCTDNPATRYLISDLCVLLGKVLVSGAAQRLEGQVMVLNYVVSAGEGVGDASGGESSRGPCYRCVFPTPPSPEMVKGCGEIGILGPVVGTIGTLMASEALRLVVREIDEVRKPSMLLYSAWPTDPRGMFRSIGLRGRRKDCVACGDEEVFLGKGLNRLSREDILEGRMDYVTFCGVVENVKILEKEQRVEAVVFLREVASTSPSQKSNDSSRRQKWRNAAIVDVREPHEIEMGPHISNGVNIPISRILRQDGAVEEMSKLLDDGRHDAMVFVCQQGNDSQVAAKRLIDWRKQQVVAESTPEALEVKGRDTIFIGDIIGGYTALEKV